MTDEPFDVEALRAKIAAEMHRTEYVGEGHQLSWVLSLLPDPPPKYEVRGLATGRYPDRGYFAVRRVDTVHVAAEFHTDDYPDAEQRAREECARLNEASR